MKEEPRLVDYSLFQKSKVNIIKSVKIPVSIPKKSDNSLIINCIGLLILCIGGLCLYQRLTEKDKNELEKQNIIIGFHQYVKEKIK